MKILHKHKGFTLVTAIFLLVAVAVLMAYMVNLRVLQQSTVVMAVQGARALQAARSGLEYGVYRALNGVSCLPPAPGGDTTETVTFANPTLTGFTVTVDCSASAHTEATTTFNVYTITALAERGGFAMGTNANPDYVSRRLRVTVSDNPP